MAEVPPPPENPFAAENPEANFPPVDEGESLDQGRPSVAAAPGKVLIIVGVVGLIIFILLYNIFSSGKKDDKDKNKKQKPRPVATAELQPPSLPEAPPIPIAPPPTISAPSIPEPTKIDILKPEDNGAAKQQEMDRMKSKLMQEGGGSSGSSGGGLSNILGGGAKPTPKQANNDPNSLFAAATIENSSQAEHVQATRIADLRHTIGQGRIIEATMESAINTDLSAPIRAIISRDVYAEAGTEALIPKGSRLIGVYNSDVTGGQSRVFVVWTRVIRPDGVDVAIGSPLIDQIGQAGIGGQVDSKFQSVFSRAILSSVVSIAFAIGSDKISGGSQTTSTSADGGSSTTGDSSTTATTQAMQQLGETTGSFIQRYIDARPTILVDQGTKVNVFVNKDLVFPAEFSPSGARIIN